MTSSPIRLLTRVSLAGLLLAISFAGTVVCAQQTPVDRAEDFPGVTKALTSEQFEAAGLSKLSPEERARLDESLRGYFTGATQRVVEKAVEKAKVVAIDQAVKEKQVRPPELIQSRILGTVDGWKSGQIFILENGQHWKVTDDENRHFPAVANPDVFIVHADFFGYKMAIAGGGTARVSRVR